MSEKPVTTDDWKETVRMIFDMMHGRKFGIFTRSSSAKETAHAVIGLIEERHHQYFCEACNEDK